MTFVYILEDFAYSDFEYWVLTHEKHYTMSEFKAIIKEAMGKVEERYWFHEKLFKIIEEEYGFKRDYGDAVPTIHIDDLEREMDKENKE